MTKKKNLRVLSCRLPDFAAATRGRSRVFGRIALHQDEDDGFPELATWRVVAGEEPDAATRRALTLAWIVCKHGKSNAIVLASPEATLGCGFGQMSRVDSVKLAVRKAGEQGLDLAGCAAASDGFFPFPDGVEELARAGVRAVIAPGRLDPRRRGRGGRARAGRHPDPDRSPPLQPLAAGLRKELP